MIVKSKLCERKQNDDQEISKGLSEKGKQCEICRYNEPVQRGMEGEFRIVVPVLMTGE